MAIRRNFHPNPEIARLQRKSDQESELGSMAMSDGDKEAAKKHFAKMQEYDQQWKAML